MIKKIIFISIILLLYNFVNAQELENIMQEKDFISHFKKVARAEEPFDSLSVFLEQKNLRVINKNKEKTTFEMYLKKNFQNKDIECYFINIHSRGGTHYSYNINLVQTKNVIRRISKPHKIRKGNKDSIVIIQMDTTYKEIEMGVSFNFLINFKNNKPIIYRIIIQGNDIIDVIEKGERIAYVGTGIGYSYVNNFTSNKLDINETNSVFFSTIPANFNIGFRITSLNYMRFLILSVGASKSITHIGSFKKNIPFKYINISSPDDFLDDYTLYKENFTINKVNFWSVNSKLNWYLSKTTENGFNTWKDRRRKDIYVFMLASWSSYKFTEDIKTRPIVLDLNSFSFGGGTGFEWWLNPGLTWSIYGEYYFKSNVSNNYTKIKVGSSHNFEFGARYHFY